MSALSRRQFLRTGAAAVAAGAVAAPARAAGPDYALQGIDVSHWQAAVNWTSVRGSDKRFAFCKATDGLSYVDPRFATNWPAMRAAGLLRGAYHYARTAFDAVAQADHFRATVNPTAGDLKMVLDLEDNDEGNRTPAQVRAWVEAFVGRLVATTGQTPIIYTGFFFWRDEAGNGSNLGCPLWLAQYNTAPTLIPAAWTTWTFWQYTNAGSCPGVNGNVDRNAFNGSKTALNNLRRPA